MVQFSPFSTPSDEMLAQLLQVSSHIPYNQGALASTVTRSWMITTRKPKSVVAGCYRSDYS